MKNNSFDILKQKGFKCKAYWDIDDNPTWYDWETVEFSDTKIWAKIDGEATTYYLGVDHPPSEVQV